MEIQLSINGETSGPYTLEQVQAMLANGETNSDDYAWFEGCEDWITVGEIPEVEDAGEVEGAPVEEPEEEAEETPAEETADFYIWPEGAEDWAGPHTLSQIQDMLAKEEISASDFAAFEGASEGSTVADIPGIDETAQEAEPTEEEAPAPAKKAGLRAKGVGLKKSGFAKKGISGFGAKKTGGLTKKSGGIAKKSSGVKKVVDPSEEGGEDTQAKGKGLRLTTGILLIIGFGFNLFVGIKETFLSGDDEKPAKAQSSVNLPLYEIAETQEMNPSLQAEAFTTTSTATQAPPPGTETSTSSIAAEPPTETTSGTEPDTEPKTDNKSAEDSKAKEQKTDASKSKEPDTHALIHGYSLLAAGLFALLGAIFVLMGTGKILVLICGILIVLLGGWGIAAAFMTNMLFIGTGSCNLTGGILAIFSAKSCR